MKIVKSLLLGSTAALVAVSGTQAADLPVKAKPVQYVRICDLYGSGFYYIPGSEVCLKVGGYAQADYGWNNSNNAFAPTYTGARAANDRSSVHYVTRARAESNFDSRTQTAYGTLRTYMVFRLENADGASAFQVPRAFIQWAGFTLGRSKSIADIPGGPTPDTFRSLHQNQNVSDTGGGGTNFAAYSWELGNGMTFTVGAEERRTKAIANLSNNVVTVGTNPGTAFGPYLHPNPFLNFTVNQAWGRLALSAYLNKVNATYYNNALAVDAVLDSGSTQGTNAVSAVPGTGCPVGAGAQPGTSQCGHPDDKWGWAVLAGTDIKAPWAGPGDHFGGFFQYGVGASAYAGGNNLGSPGLFGANNTVALGVLTDAVFVNGGQFQLTTVWTAGGGYEHFWLPNVSTAWYGTFTHTQYNDTVINSRLFCNGPGANAVNQNIRGIAANVSCDPGFNYWTVGMVNNWFPVPGFRLAVDVLYVRINSAFEGQQISLGKTTGLRPTGVYTAKDIGNLSVVFRAQRVFGGAD
jgi:hypothetical protein